jgi:hypothetical protein
MLQPERKIPVTTSNTSSPVRPSQPLKIKPILKKSVHEKEEERVSRHHVNFIDSSNVKPTLLLKKREVPKVVVKEVEQENVNENELMKEFQTTLGALQKLLI